MGGMKEITIGSKPYTIVAAPRIPSKQRHEVLRDHNNKPIAQDFIGGVPSYRCTVIFPSSPDWPMLLGNERFTHAFDDDNDAKAYTVVAPVLEIDADYRRQSFEARQSA